MTRSLRLLLVCAPLLLLLIGIPTGVALAARRGTGELPPEVAGGPGVLLPYGPPAPTRPPRPYGPPAPTNAPWLGPKAPTPAPVLGPKSPTAPSLSTAQNGVAGRITRIDKESITVYTRARKIAIISIDPQTTIRFRGKDVNLNALKRGDDVTILGKRDRENAFHAVLIRADRPDPPDPGNGKPH